jgi:GNAT superfamily N-acetyltransferase
VRYDPHILERAERRFWWDIWEAVPGDLAGERGIARRDVGPVQATIVGELASLGMLNLVLGASERGAVADGHLAAAVRWAQDRGVSPFVPLAPGLAESERAEAWLAREGFAPGYAWMKFVRDAHPPRFRSPEVEVVEIESSDQAPFGMIAATGFGLPAWAAGLFATLPERQAWRCYVANLGGEPQACAAMHLHDGVAEFGIAATLEPARGHGCQLALLHRRIRDAAAAGCRTLSVKTGERVPDRPSPSYRNILRAGFEEACLRPNWRLG